MLRRPRVATLLLVVVGAAISCQAPRTAPTPASSRNTDGAPPALHNVQRVTDTLISGGMPQGDAGFDALRKLGVRTIISVDGATPDVERARARSMRYVHVPVGYDGIRPDAAAILARAARDLPGPIYLHCHHGRHRGPAACALIAVMLGQMSTQDGEAFLRLAGTSPDYPGLFASVAAARPITPAELDAVPPSFPEIAPRPAFVQAMSMAQDAYDHLVEIRDAGWAVPPHHPDLVPAAEAARLESLLRGLQDDQETLRRPDGFRHLMAASQAAAAALETAIVSAAPAAELAARLSAVGRTCRDCHVPYRNPAR